MRFINHISLNFIQIVYLNKNEKYKIEHYSEKEALEFHNSGKSGKLKLIPQNQ